MKRLNIFINSIIKYIQCHEVPGKYWLYEKTKLKQKDRLITYSIKNSDFSIPWDQWCFWHNYGPENYYLDEMLPFTAILNEQLSSFDFFDLGADVGVVSALVNKHSCQLNNIFAFEPNPKTFSVLSKNLSNIGVQHHAFNKAVSNVNSTCHFNFEAHLGSDHEGFIDTKVAGETQVVSLDTFISDNQLNVSNNIALKIDVEGQEINTLEGAKQLITQASKVVILLEIHPDVLSRDGESAEELFAQAESIRDFQWYVPLLGNKPIDRSRDFFEQFPKQQYDVIAVSD